MQVKQIPLQKAIAHHPRLGLVALLLLGMTLRFWHLDAKPLWLDEVLTALFTMGRHFSDVPLNQFVSLEAIAQVFTYRSGLSCAQIAQTVVTESVHPPLFFCLMYHWLGWLKPDAAHWVWVLRSLPALIGVGAIAAVYALNRLAFSPPAGLMAAALMAVSPFAVYLSQEARHYTLPMLLITLALLGLVQIQRDLRTQRLRPWVWLGWTGVNLLSLYVHYFCLLAIAAQVGALVIWLIWQRRSELNSMRLSKWQIGAIALSVGGIAIGFLPWFSTFISHIHRPETDWLIPYHPSWLDRIAPLYQILIGWTLMFIGLPVEKQPLPIAVFSGALMLGFMLWLAGRVRRGFSVLWQQDSGTASLSEVRPAIVLLTGFILCVIGEFLAIAYLLGKDLTMVPRYNFVYYPAVCAIVGAGLSAGAGRLARRLPEALKPRPFRPVFHLSAPLFLLLVGLLSSLLVVNGLVFLKSYNPDRVARNIRFEPETPIVLAVGYESLQEVALGLSFALALRQVYSQSASTATERPVQTIFLDTSALDKSAGYRQAWKTLAEQPQPLPLPLNLWVVASPGMRSTDYPRQLRLTYTPSSASSGSIPQRSEPVRKLARTLCEIDPTRYHRVGFPYQLFRCFAK
jgi:uncharacterized membrane protein